MGGKWKGFVLLAIGFVIWIGFAIADRDKAERLPIASESSKPLVQRHLMCELDAFGDMLRPVHFDPDHRR